MDFVVNGKMMSLTADQVERRLHGIAPESVQTHGVRVAGTIYPVKQVFALATGLGRDEFTSQTARRHLTMLGFSPTGTASAREITTKQATPSEPVDPHDWPWEGAVQEVFASYLRQYGWSVTGTADTATKAHGVDLLASKGNRLLGAEVKGWPSKVYADLRRASEIKKTQPTTQAVHWFSQALLKAMMLLDSHPDHESLVVLPDSARYRDLARRTVTGRTAAKVHVIFVQSAGTAESDSWSP